MRLDASGNLGLGVTPSAWVSTTNALQLKESWAALSSNTFSGSLDLTNNAYQSTTSTWIYRNTFTASRYQQLNGVHSWYNAPSGTAGNAITFTQAMTLDASGNLGIGTTSPSGKLHIAATTGVATPGSIALAIRDAGNSGFGFDFNLEGVATGDLSLMRTESNTQSQVMTFKRSNGNVGIGTTSPTSLLHINSGTTATQTVANFAAANYASPSSRTYIQIGTQYGDGSSRIGSVNTTGNQSALIFQTQSASSGVWNDAMYINGSGNVGIGTTSPNAPLSVVTNASAQGINIFGRATDNYGVLRFQNNAGSSSYATVYSNAADLIFEVPTERMRITSGGEVYIAGTTDQGAYNLQVNGTGVWGAGAYVNGSDSSLKENIQNMGSALDLVNQLQPKTYTYKPSYSKDSTIQVGFIAQDLEQVLANQNYKGSIVVDGPNFKSVAYQNLIPLLVQSIKELKAEIETLKNK
jgi:hypothetical protein